MDVIVVDLEFGGYLSWINCVKTSLLIRVSQYIHH